MASTKKYAKDLNSLINDSYEAKSYFISLPDYVRGGVIQHADSVHSLSELQNYAQNLLFGNF